MLTWFDGLVDNVPGRSERQDKWKKAFLSNKELDQSFIWLLLSPGLIFPSVPLQLNVNFFTVAVL